MECLVSPFPTTEHRASHCFLPQSPWHESPGVPNVIFLIVVFIFPVTEPCVSFGACCRHCRPEAAFPCRQTAQGHQWIGGDREDVCQGEFCFNLILSRLSKPVRHFKRVGYTVYVIITNIPLVCCVKNRWSWLIVVVHNTWHWITKTPSAQFVLKDCSCFFIFFRTCAVS